jgi:hypothetical protein
MSELLYKNADNVNDAIELKTGTVSVSGMSEISAVFKNAGRASGQFT